MSWSFARFPLVIVTVVPLGTKSVEAALMLKTAACPVTPCGFTSGNACSLAMIVKPPISKVVVADEQPIVEIEKARKPPQQKETYHLQ